MDGVLKLHLKFSFENFCDARICHPVGSDRVGIRYCFRKHPDAETSETSPEKSFNLPPSLSDPSLGLSRFKTTFKMWSEYVQVCVRCESEREREREPKIPQTLVRVQFLYIYHLGLLFFSLVKIDNEINFSSSLPKVNQRMNRKTLLAKGGREKIPFSSSKVSIEVE